LIILLSSALNPSDASGRADRISREIPSANQFPCYLDLIPLLFGCYSAVNSAVIPLLFRCRRRQFILQIPETANVFETIFAKDGCIGFFLPSTVKFGFPADPESVRGEPPRAGGRERGMLEKHA
jgi:hypothetical protein